MSRPNIVAAIGAALVCLLLIWHASANWRYRAPPDASTRHLRYKLGWELRSLVLVAAVTIGVCILFGYVPRGYIISLLLFLTAGLLSSEMIAPNGVFWGRDGTHRVWRGRPRS